MTDTKMTVDAGACRFTTKIHAVSEDGMNVTFTAETDCPSVKELIASLGEVDGMDAVMSQMADNALMAKCGMLPHPACPVPCALVKACEVACDLGLKKEVTIKFE